MSGNHGCFRGLQAVAFFPGRSGTAGRFHPTNPEGNETMTKRTVLATMTAALVLGTAAGGAQWRAQAANADWQPLTLIYQTDIKGKVDPCG